MKLLKGLFAIALISMIAVSCTGEKKEANATNEKVEVVGDANSKENKMATHVCDENCKEGNCPHHAKMDGKKCVETKCSNECTDKNCEKCAAKKAECKAKCDAKKDGEKCVETKCSKECTDKDCEKCAAKKAECKAKCDAKKVNKEESKE